MPGDVQRSYELYPDYGYPGQIAQGYGLFHVEEGPIHVPAAATRKPRPGDAVYYDKTENGFAIPTSAAQSARVLGILTYRSDTVANEESILEYDDEDAVQVCVFGTVFRRGRRQRRVRRPYRVGPRQLRLAPRLRARCGRRDRRVRDRERPLCSTR